MEEIGTASIGLANELVMGFIFFGTEDSEALDAFLFFTAARSAALVFFTSKAEGRIGVGVGAGGAEESGCVASGATDAVALVSSVSSRTSLVDALAISSGAGAESSALELACSSVV